MVLSTPFGLVVDFKCFKITQLKILYRNRDVELYIPSSSPSQCIDIKEEVELSSPITTPSTLKPFQIKVRWHKQIGGRSGLFFLFFPSREIMGGRWWVGKSPIDWRQQDTTWRATMIWLKDKKEKAAMTVVLTHLLIRIYFVKKYWEIEPTRSSSINYFNPGWVLTILTLVVI